MAVKTFTTETLTSADTNTYLANSGLVYVTNGTITTATNIPNVFTSTYDNYEIVFSNITVAAGATLVYLQLSVASVAAATAYNYGGNFTLYTGATTGVVSGPGTYMYVAQSSTTPISGARITLQRPAIASATTFQVQSGNYDSGVHAGGNHTTATAYDGFKISSVTSTPSLSYAVYGYRKA